MFSSTALSDFLSVVVALITPGIFGFAIILGLIVPYTVRAYRQISRANSELDREFEYLKKCKAGLIQLQEARRYAEIEDIRGWLSGVDGESRVLKCVQAVWSTRTIPNPDLEAISSMLSQSESHRLGVAKGTPNALMLSGLIGTVLGLAGAVSRLPQQIQGSSQAVDPIGLTQNLSSTLQHMQGAFACTFWGILLAVIVSRKVNATGARQSAFLAELQEFGLLQLSPYVIRANVASQLGDVFEKSQKFMERICGLMQDAAGRFETILNNAGNAMASSANELHNVSLNVLDGAQALKQSSDELQNSHNDMQKVHAAMETFFVKSKEELERQGQEQLSKMHELQQDFAKSAQGIVYAINNTSDGLSGATQAFGASGRTFRDAADQMSLKLDTGFQQMKESITGSLDKHDAEMSHVEDAVNRVNDWLADLSVRLDPRMLPREEWDKLTTCLQAITDVLLQNRGLKEQVDIALPSQEMGTNSLLRELENTLRRNYEGMTAMQQELLEAIRAMGESGSIIEQRFPTREEWRAFLNAGNHQYGAFGMGAEVGIKSGEMAMDTDDYPNSGNWGNGSAVVQGQVAGNRDQSTSADTAKSWKSWLPRVLARIRRRDI